MKKICFFLLLLLCLTPIFAQQTDTEFISTMRMDHFRLGTTKAEIEAIINKPLVNNEYEFKVTYKGSTYILVFGGSGDEAPLYSVKSTNTKLKTKSGVGIGSNKMHILGVYDKYNIGIWNLESNDSNIPKDKIQLIELHDYDARTCIWFKTVDRIVTEITVGYYEGC